MFRSRGYKGNIERGREKKKKKERQTRQEIRKQVQRPTKTSHHDPNLAIRCCFAHLPGEIIRAIFESILGRFSLIALEALVDFHQISVSFSQAQSMLVNFSQFLSVLVNFCQL